MHYLCMQAVAINNRSLLKTPPRPREFFHGGTAPHKAPFRILSRSMHEPRSDSFWRSMQTLLLFFFPRCNCQPTRAIMFHIDTCINTFTTGWRITSWKRISLPLCGAWKYPRCSSSGSPSAPSWPKRAPSFPNIRRFTETLLIQRESFIHEKRWYDERLYFSDFCGVGVLGDRWDDRLLDRVSKKSWDLCFRRFVLHCENVVIFEINLNVLRLDIQNAYITKSISIVQL